jgi:hypothetical protein
MRLLLILSIVLASASASAQEAQEEPWKPRYGDGWFVEVGGAGNSVTGVASGLFVQDGFQVGGAVGRMVRFDTWAVGIDAEVYYYGGVKSPLVELDGVTFLTHARVGIVIAERFMPYGKLGIGGITGNVKSALPTLSTTSFAISVGGGGRAYVTEAIYLFFDATWLTEIVSGPAYQQVRYGGGAGFTF